MRFDADIAASGTISAPLGDFQSLTVSGQPVSTGTGGGGAGTITDINEQGGPSVTITGAGNVETITAGNVITVSGVSDLALGSSIVFIREVTLSADATSLDIENIPQEASNLVIEVLLRTDRANVSDAIRLTFNDDSGTNYDSSWRGFYDDNTSTGSAVDGTGLAHIRTLSASASTGPANYMGGGTLRIGQYSRNDITKNVHGTGFYSEGTSAGQQRTQIAAGHWRDTSAITKISFAPDAGTNILAGSTVTVYGMASEIATYTENIVSASGTFYDSLQYKGEEVAVLSDIVPTSPGEGTTVVSGAITRPLDLSYSPVALWTFENNNLVDEVSAITLTVNGAGTTQFARPGGNSVAAAHLDGLTMFESSDASLLTTGDLTYEALVVNGVDGTSGATQWICGWGGPTGDGNSANNFISRWSLTATNQQSYFAEEGTGSPNISYSSGWRGRVPGDPRTLTHIAMVRESNEIQFYVNGRPQGDKSSGLGAPNDGSAGKFLISGNYDDGDHFTGMISCVKVFDKALSSAQILNEYERTLAFVESPDDIVAVSGTFSESLTISGIAVPLTGGGGSALTVKEADGVPSVADVDTIVVTNGTLTDDGGGQVTISTGGGIGGSAGFKSALLSTTSGVSIDGFNQLMNWDQIRFDTDGDTGQSGLVDLDAYDLGFVIPSGSAEWWVATAQVRWESIADTNERVLNIFGVPYGMVRALTDNSTNEVSHQSVTSYPFQKVNGGVVTMGLGEAAGGTVVADSATGATWFSIQQVAVSGSAAGGSSFDPSSNQTITGEWDFNNSLTVSGVPVSTGTGGGGSASSLQDAYDNDDGTITTTGGKPFELTGTGELVAVTGTFTDGLTVGTGSTVINNDSITTTSGNFDELFIDGVSTNGPVVADQSFKKLFHVSDRKSLNTAGGTFTQAVFQTRDLNTVESNEIDGASLSANQITLPAGDYYGEFSAPAYDVNEHKAWLFAPGPSVAAVYGSSNYSSASNNGMNFSHGAAKFSLDVQTVFEIRHRCTTTKTTTGYGVPSNYSPWEEIYTQVRIWKFDSRITEIDHLVAASGTFSNVVDTSRLIVNGDEFIAGSSTTISGVIARNLSSDHSPVGLWHFDQSLVDVSGNGLDLSVINGQESYSNVNGVQGFKFTGDDTLGHAANALLEITGDVTIEVLLSSDDLSNNREIVSYADQTLDTEVTNFLYGLRVTTGGGLRYDAEHSAGTNISYTIDDGPSLATLNHITLVRESADVTFYLNGYKVGASSSGLTAPTGGTSAKLNIGLQDGFGDELEGVICGLKIVPSALTSSQVYEEYEQTFQLSPLTILTDATVSGIIGKKLGLEHDPVALYLFDDTATDSSGNGLDLTVNQGTIRYTSVNGLRAFKATSASSVRHNVTGTALEITGDVTVQALVLHDNQTSGFDYLVSYGVSGESEATNCLYSIRYAASTEELGWFQEHGAGATDAQFAADASSVATLQLVTAVRSGTTVTLYIDGVEVGSDTLTVPTGGTSSKLNIGDYDGGSGLSGAIACVKIIDSALTAAQVYAEYQSTWADAPSSSSGGGSSIDETQVALLSQVFGS